MNGWQTTLGGLLYMVAELGQHYPAPWAPMAAHTLQSIAIGWLGYHAAVQQPAK